MEIELEAARPLKPMERALAYAMENLSENVWAAGWDSTTSEGVWSLLVDDRWSNVWSASPDEIAMFRELAEMTGSWIVWDNTIDNLAAVPLDEWRRMYSEWRDAGRRLLDGVAPS